MLTLSRRVVATKVAIGMLLTPALATLPAQVPRQQRPSIVRDSAMSDSTPRRAPRRLAVTAEALRTAFRDDRARELVLRARSVRLA